MRQQKQPAVALAFNRQHARGTAPTHLQPADVAPHQQAETWATVLARTIPTAGSRDAALSVLNALVVLIQDGRWQDLDTLESCADYIIRTTPEQRLKDKA